MAYSLHECIADRFRGVQYPRLRRALPINRLPFAVSVQIAVLSAGAIVIGLALLFILGDIVYLLLTSRS
jgi:hypothetical protein